MSSFPEKTITVTVSRDGQDKRFDAALFALLEKLLPGRFSRSEIGRLIRAGEAFRNGQKTKPSTPVSQGDILTLSLPETAQNEPLSANSSLKMRVLAETDDFVALDKPAGLQTHPARKDTGGTLANWIVTAYPDAATVGEDPLRPGIMHRLDRDTSGVIVIAKTEKGFDELKKTFHDRLAAKTYVALVFGHLETLSGTIDLPLGQRSGELRRRVDDGTIPNAREAVTDYRVIARYAECDLVLAMPKTGRTHQIRAHFAALGHPVIGDQLYASRQSKKSSLTAPRQMLHAWKLSVPFSSEKFDFQAPLPDDFRSLLAALDGMREASYDDEALESLFLT